MDQQLLEEFKTLILNGYYNAKSAHSAIFSDKVQLDNSIIIGYLAIANSYVNSAKSVYICKNELSRQEFDDFFNEFKMFSNEVMDNISNNNGHQQSNLHFQRLTEVFQLVASLLGVFK
ncbi:hypothetical protein Desor_3710 [Desulfosporosinus orientis DSM 765]|uniref:Uncharacterized protein n=1 Tax=Desulfosporosinus orientis (strain ATCC 19365 / DSM 765 / NCIMB 8382 / VKM B-1628 / Singapore I) TaxID=768706 RepID=G7W6P6_DESOD|nr:hypothetical protein [Desulfosporosinus orientis]AET69178.1 hypothetical protein Desor_3710 [Desulfosporosinus orientis DSM 765]